MNNAPAFAAAQQTSRMINRAAEMARLKEAMCRPGNDTRLVIIKAAGGLGKTRLLSEALWRAGHPTVFPQRGRVGPKNDWDIREQVIVSNVLDFSESKLHTFDDFMERLRNSFNWHPGAGFSKFDSALSAYRHRRKDHVDFSAIEIARKQAHSNFFTDYRQLSLSYRLVWALDTLEQLRYPGAPWLKEKALLTPDDLHFSTREQLVQLLAEGRFPNTTILLAGRPGAEDYYTELAGRAEGNFTVETIDLTVFNLNDTKNYLLQLQQDYTADKTRPDFDPDTAEALSSIARIEQTAEGKQEKFDKDQIEVLHRYTGGKPVLLALFTDVLVEGREIPAALQDTLEQAQERLKDKSLAQIQFDIEAEFINLIFYKTGDIRSRILTALARARRGLDLDRLAFILGSAPGQSPDDFRSDEAQLKRNIPALRQEITAELDEENPHSLRYLSFVKRGHGGRLILQDELYRIYDYHMAYDETSRRDESDARRALYEQLHNYAKAEIERLREKRNKNRRQDEASLQWSSPAEALSKTFRYPGRIEEARRIAQEEETLEAQLERLHYKLRLDPGEGIIDPYVDPGQHQMITGMDAAGLYDQIELWRFAQYTPGEEHWRAFIDIPEKDWPVLEQVIAADDVHRWLSRFFTRGQFERVIEFVDQIETALATLSKTERDILSHPFFLGERRSWQEFTQTYLSADIPNNIQALNEVIGRVQKLVGENFPARNPFKLRPRTVEIRLRRTLGTAYNSLGYSHTTLGHYREANTAYTQALRYLRDTEFWNTEATVRNNLSRVLSELGLVTRALRICRNGLELREHLGDEAPIAASHSTLALIYNNGMQPENAWVEAATAAAYFRKLENDRGLGLALYHLAESLRRLATAPREKLDSPDRLFETAMEAIDKAVEIFADNPEKMRLIEVSIEQGCLYRDYMHYLKQQGYALYTDYINDAINPLKRAVALAEELGYPRHHLDAQVDLAWAYYYAEQEEAAETAFEDSLTMALELVGNDPSRLLTKDGPPPTPDKAEPHVFMLMGKAWMLMGQIYLDRFVRRQKELRPEHPERPKRLEAVHRDQTARDELWNAAKAFVLALAYNRLYSTRSPSIPVIFDRLYDYLKKFNRTELRDFFYYQDVVKEKYRVAEINPTDLTDMGPFLEQSFGDYLTPLPGLEEVD